jgi:cyclohexanecarboxylate-CoA ligase
MGILPTSLAIGPNPVAGGTAIAQVRAKDELLLAYRAGGIWRDSGPLADLRNWRSETPEAIAIIAEHTGSTRVRLTFAEYARAVDRFAGALRELGVGRGDVVVVQLPSRWQIPALMLACLRIGAIFAPIMTTIRPREVERILRRLKAPVCVTIDHWDGFAHADALAEMGKRLPRLRHRVVLGDINPQRGDVSFAETFEGTAWEEHRPIAVSPGDEDPDRAALVLFTSGTSGEPKGVLHSMNTLYAGAAPVVSEEGLGQSDRFFTSAPLTHIFGTIYGTLMPLLTGGTAVVRDSWEPAKVLALLAESQVTVFAGAPVFLAGLLSAAERDPAVPLALRMVFSGATTVPRRLVTDTHKVLGVPLRTLWGMTEVAGHTWTRKDDPEQWGAHSDGRAGPGVEISLRSETEITREQPGRLFVRGGGVCLATFGRDSGALRILADHDDGWYDTGDLAVTDGRGGIRLMGRVGDRIGGAFMIPVNDVEAALIDHPAVADVALVGYPDGGGGELACAFIVTASPTSVDLAMVREYLTSAGMTQWYQPSRVEIIPALPRNGSGKVRKDALRKMLANNMASN